MWKFWNAPKSSNGDWPRVILSAPPVFAEALSAASPSTAPTYETLLRLFQSAVHHVKVFSPYADPTVTSLIAATRAPVSVVTTSRDGRRAMPNPVLERLSGSRPVVVRYLVERRDGAQMFQMHAKLVLSDARAAYVGSANLTDTSLHYNLELGLLTTEPAEIRTLETLFDHVFGHLAVPAKLL